MNSLAWYCHRLRAMPPAEILHRLKHRVHAERIRRLGPPVTEEEIRVPPDAQTGLRFDDARFDAFRANPVPWERIAAKALGPERNRFSLLGAPERDFGSPIDWHMDSVTGESWPREAESRAINYRSESRLGEVKFAWELGRMPWLLPRAFAARVLKSRELAETVIEDIGGFVRANPPYRGVHWTSGIEMGVRVIAWTWSLALVRPLASPPESLWRELSCHVALYADYCNRFPSLYSSANNHLIAEAVTMEVAGRAWPWIPRARFFAERGSAILDREISRQILPDGYSIEMCPAYLVEVAEWSLAAARVRAESGGEVPVGWRDRWSALAGLLQVFCAEGERLPALGDSDDAVILPTGEPHSPRGIADVLLVACGAPCSGAALVGDPLGALVLPAREVAQGADHEAAPVPQAHLFRDGGIVVMRSGATRLVFDCGPHGMPPIHAHAHADALSVTFDVGGIPVLVDPGTFCYHGLRRWRDWFRSTAAHNTVVVDGADQSEIRGPFLWGRVAKTRIVEWREEPDPIAVAEHYGYSPLVHRRRVKGRNGGDWVVEDHVGAAAAGATRGLPREVVVWWHFAPGEVEIGAQQATWSNGSLRVALSWDSTSPVRATLHTGEENPPQGWFSPAFSVKHPAPALALRLAPGLPARCVTTIRVIGTVVRHA